MFWVSSYQNAYIAKLSFSLTILPSFPRSARAGSNTGISQEYLLIFYILNESILDLKVSQ